MLLQFSSSYPEIMNRPKIRNQQGPKLLKFQHRNPIRANSAAIAIPRPIVIIFSFVFSSFLQSVWLFFFQPIYLAEELIQPDGLQMIPAEKGRVSPVVDFAVMPPAEGENPVSQMADFLPVPPHPNRVHVVKLSLSPAETAPLVPQTGVDIPSCILAAV